MTLDVDLGRSTYAVRDLAVLDDACRAAAAGLGLLTPDVVFHLCPAERIYDIAARGLPGRYGHWRFGRAYEQQKAAYDHGASRIYELVLNTEPVQAYLLDGNSLAAQLLVIAHVYGHAHVFRANRWLASSDRRILGRVRAAAERIEGYARREGRAVVEDFIDAASALALHAPPAGGLAAGSAGAAVPRDAYADLFPAETAAAGAARRAREEAEEARVPRRPEEDLLGFLAAHAPRLEDWQRDVLAIARDEARWMAPNRRTQVLNEGMAVLVHHRILQELQLDTAPFVEIELLHAGVVQPHPGRVNVYSLGHALLREVLRIHDEPTDDDRERYATVGQVGGWERVLEIVEGYDDAALIAEHCTERVCEECRLFAWERTADGPVRVTSREAEDVRAALLAERASGGVPRLAIVDADGHRAGALLIRHLHEGVGLDEEYARGTLPYVAAMWGRRVVLETIGRRPRERGTSPVWLVAEPGGEVRVERSEPLG